MKQRTQYEIRFTTLLLGVIICLMGCATTGIERSGNVTTTMQTVAKEINQINVLLDATGTSLENLTKWGQSDVKKAFNSYTANVVKMDKLEKKFAKHADEMRSRGIEYFAEWKKQGDAYDNPRIRKLSEQRRAALSEIYGKIAEAGIGVNSAFKAYTSDLKEIQTYLSNDLTPKGITAITPISEKVVWDGKILKDAVNNVQAAIDRARTEMAQQ